MENKKVKNARKHHFDGIDFKSGLEVDTYKALLKEGLTPEYEKHTYVLQESRLFPTLHYAPYKDRKIHKEVWGLNKYKIISVKYKPDFVFTIRGKLIVIEVKGWSNDRYPYQKKLFFKWLEDNNPDSVFFEVHNKVQLKATIEIIKQIRHENKDCN